MTKGLYQYVRQAWKKPDKAALRVRMIEWRKGNRITVLERPTRIDRARSLGYKAKKGFIIARVVIERGGRKKTRPNKKRRTKRQTIRKVLKINYKGVAEGRAEKKFKNLIVLNSYLLSKDGKYAFYEVILVDPDKPEIKSDKQMSQFINKKNTKRASRGLTSTNKKSRGLRSKHPENKKKPKKGKRIKR